MLQCVAVCCGVLQCVLQCVLQRAILSPRAVAQQQKQCRCCIVLQFDAVCCSGLFCLRVLLRSSTNNPDGAVWYSVLQSVVVCCSVLQCIAVCCSVLQQAILFAHAVALHQWPSLTLQHCNALQHNVTRCNTLQNTTASS